VQYIPASPGATTTWQVTPLTGSVPGGGLYHRGRQEEGRVHLRFPGPVRGPRPHPAHEVDQEVHLPGRAHQRRIRQPDQRPRRAGRGHQAL